MLLCDLFAVLNLLPEAALVTDRSGTVLFASDSAKALLGASGRGDTRALRLRWLDPAFEWSVRELTLERADVQVALVRPRPAAKSDADVRGSALSGARGGADPWPPVDTALLVEALRTNEQRLRHATHAAQVGIFEHAVFPQPPPPPYWSSTLRAMLGVEASAVPDFEWFRARVHPDDGPTLDAAIEHAMGPSGDGCIDIAYRWLHPAKGYRWLLNRSVAQYIERDGRPIPERSLGAIIDVTERRIAEEELRLRAAILDATPDFVGIARLDGTFVYLNRAARAFLGVAPEGVVDGFGFAQVHAPEVLAQLREVATPAALSRGSWSGETEFTRYDGGVLPMSQVLLAQRDSAGTVAYLCTIARDLSKERNLEEQFRQAQKMEAVGQLAGGVAHDFNNLLSVILGYAELAVGDLAEDSVAQRSLLEIVRAGERAAALTSQLLAFGRRQILKPRILNVNDVLSDFVPMLRRLIDESVQLHIIPARTPANIRADPNQIQQVLLNLAVNARDAMPEGGTLTVEAFRVALDETQATSRLDLSAGVYTVIAVSDTGHGMDAATRSRIFEPFFTTKGPGAGTGLGLATVFGIVQQSGGSIWVYSEPGLGTTFKVYLPCTAESAEASLSRAPFTHVGHGDVILLAEDDEQVRGLSVDILERAGYQVLSASRPAEALELSSQHAGDIDLLITDVVMPEMTGTLLAQKLQKTRPGLPVLFTSGYTENAVVHQGMLDAGVNFLAKPITPGGLLSAIAEILHPSDLSRR